MVLSLQRRKLRFREVKRLFQVTQFVNGLELYLLVPACCLLLEFLIWMWTVERVCQLPDIGCWCSSHHSPISPRQGAAGAARNGPVQHQADLPPGLWDAGRSGAKTPRVCPFSGETTSLPFSGILQTPPCLWDKIQSP